MNATGDRIKDERKKLGLTQEQLGKKVHVTKQSVSKWENGTNLPEPPILNELAKLFDCTVDYLLGNTNIRKKLTVSQFFAGPGKLKPEIIRELMNSNENGNATFAIVLEDKLKKSGLYDENMSYEEKVKLANKILEILKIVQNK